MKPKIKERRSLEEILESTRNFLFPEWTGNKKVKVNSRDCMGDTPLHIMVMRQDRYAVELLIENGADVNSIGDMGLTPLHVALGKEDFHIINLLLSSGAKSDIRSEFGDTAREKALNIGGEIAKLFK